MLAWRVYWLYTRYHTRVDPSDSTRIFTFRRRPQIRGCAKHSGCTALSKICCA